MGDEALLQIARRAPNEWPPRKVAKLLGSFDFECWDGSEHIVCRHKIHRDVYHVIPRHRRVRPYIVREAVKRIEEVQRREVDHDD